MGRSISKNNLKNLFSLSSIQVLNYILPLITMPYLVRTMGVSGYGLIGFAQSVMMYFLMIIDYGFNITGTRSISINRENKEKINFIYSKIMAAKLLLMILCFLILTGMILFIPKMRADPLLYLIFYGIVIGNGLFPVFVFQGLEEMGSIGILNFVSKMIFTLGLFVFVKSADDINVVALLNALGYLTMGILAQVIVHSRFRVRYVKVVFKDVKDALTEGFHLFVANIASTAFTTTNMFVLGLMKGNTAAGYFNLAYTLIRVCGIVITPITQTFYPKVAYMYNESKDQALSFIKKLFKTVTILFAIGCLILLFGSTPILGFIFGHKFDHSFNLIKLMSFLPLLMAWESTLGTMTITIIGHQKVLSKIYFSVAVISIPILLLLTYFFSETGTAISALLAEILIVFQMAVFLRKQHVSLIS